MGMKDSRTARYSNGAVLLHWVIALALAAQIGLGFGMPRDASGFALYQLHKSIGISILLLTLVRIGWRLTHARPAPIEGGWEGRLASTVHIAFYGFMILAPLTGWALVSTAPIEVPTLLFGTVPWPHLPLVGAHELWEESHEVLAYIGIALFLLHVAGALRHHYLLHDTLLARMAPKGMPAAALALGVAVVALGEGVYLASGPAERIEERGEQLAREADAAETEAVEEARDADEQAAGEAEADEAEQVEEQVASPAVEQAEEAAPAAAAPPPSWSIQPGGSLRFSVDNGGTAIRGRFDRWSGDIVFDPQNPATAEIAIRIDLASASTGDATQDNMLRSAEFLASGINPTATWRSRRVTRVDGNRYRAEGTLSLKGASHPQALTFTLAGTGNARSVTGNATIDRNAFAVGTGSSAANLADNVSLDFAFDATR